jgi:cytochrome c
MPRLRASALICAAILLSSSLLLARVHPFGDARLYTPPPSTAPIPQQTSIPTQVRQTLITKCADCHSTQTRAPIYARFAPISWLMERDIIEGRHHLNFSNWDRYNPDQQQILLAKIVAETKSGKMPLPQYRIIHRNATITPSDRQLLTAWAHTDQAPQPEPASASTSTPQTPSTQSDAAQGKLIFEKRCTGCHTLDPTRKDPNLEGPNLHGVFGRTSGQFPNYAYSATLKNAHVVWDETTLDRWLTDPDAFLPGNNMDFHVPKSEERQALIRFFKEQATH